MRFLERLACGCSPAKPPWASACAGRAPGAMRLAFALLNRSATRRGGPAVEGARQESVYTGNRIAGSNPAPSAIRHVTGADSRASHYHSELIRRRRVSKRLFPLVLAIAALSIVRVRAREFAPVTNERLLQRDFSFRFPKTMLTCFGFPKRPLGAALKRGERD